MTAPKKTGKKPSKLFKGHEQVGRKHLPPMLTLPVPMALREFRKTAFPDFIWLLTMLNDRPLARGAGPTGAALDLGQAAYRKAHARNAFGEEREPVFHGLLTDWERVPEPERVELLAELRAAGIYEVVASDALVHSLAAYAEAPGRWLIEPRLPEGLAPSLLEAEKHLWELMRLGGDSHSELGTHAIYLWLRGLLVMGRIRFPPEPVFVDILPRYPNSVTEEERKIAESTLRAMFLSMFHDLASTPATLAWCQRFWRANKNLYDCLRATPAAAEAPDLDKARLGAERIARRMAEFLVATNKSDSDLYDPDRHDVLTGMTWRVLRIAHLLVAHPAQWSEENGYPAVREMFEAVVQMRYALSVEGERPLVWAEFKNYGRGRTKALKLHIEETLAGTTGTPKEILAGLLPKLTQAANRDRNEHFQEISTASTFIEGVSLEKMAAAVGMGDLYGSMSPASSALHGDWSALDDLFLDRCRHLLHGPHALPKLELAGESDERLPFLADSSAQWVMETYYEAVGYQPEEQEDDQEDDHDEG
jgi:hypothetical protein